MPFIRHTRDKRGFESLYVMHAYRPTPESPHRTRVLYLFRSPTQLKVGRQPLDSEVMEALEHTHPDVSFDWNALTRERTAPHLEVPDRGPRRAGSQRPPPQQRQAPSDGSMLGRVLGAGQASALRRRYLELSERVTRRAPTPELRDRLLERLKRLNPDDWADEAAAQAGSRTIHADLSAISAELPGRRRGRRGGRRRESGMEAGSGDPVSPAGAGQEPVGPSAIMDEDGPHHEAEGSAPVDWPDADAPDPGDGGDGADADAAPESAENAGLHDDDRSHHD
ncbi:MAG TPA: hypothetical protein VFO31_10550 [Vicinamibacterales bacterium]|nr:hypothetical protein [Vicinamibacterales bacterium]